jgi:DNA-binding response OmpR family regulator
MAGILIVGDDEMLLETRARLLRDWQVSVNTSRLAAESIESIAYDLIIFCQTVPDQAAQMLINQARELNPTVKTLALHVSGQEREIGADLYEIQLQNPGRLLTVVDRLLQPSSFKSSDEEPVQQA